MLTAERRRLILGRLERDGKVVASELVSALGVSEDTVRRDLRELAAHGLIQRVHGGALPSGAAGAPFAERAELARESKAALAEAVLPVLDGARVIILDGGTSNVELARRLPADRPCTVLTNAPPVAVALAGNRSADVVLLGGHLDKAAQVAVGPATVDALRRVHADVVVLGVCSLHPDVGVTANDHEEAEVKRAMVAAAGEVVALAGAEKLGTAGPWVVAGVRDIAHLVTDAEPGATEVYARAGVTVVRA